MARRLLRGRLDDRYHHAGVTLRRGGLTRPPRRGKMGIRNESPNRKERIMDALFFAPVAAVVAAAVFTTVAVWLLDL